MNQYLKYFVICIIYALIFTAFVYNFEIFLDCLQRLYERQTLIHILTASFYFGLYRTIKKRSGISSSVIFLFCVICPIVIDLSVLITAPNLIPSRFPFATLFPLLGAYLGYLSYSIKRQKFIIAILMTIVLFYFTDSLFLPKIYYYQAVRNSPKIDNKIRSYDFYSVNGSRITIKDTVKSEYTIIELFFVGCLPCEEKRLALNILNDSLQPRKLSIVYVCDGTITTEDDFKKYASKNQRIGTIFLYDRTGILNSKMGLNSFPFEIFFKENIPISTLKGYSEVIKKEYLIEKFKKIK